MYGVVGIGNEIDRKPKRVALHPRILQQQGATDVPRVGNDNGRRQSYKSPEVGAIGWEIGPSTSSVMGGRNYRGRVCLTEAGATEDTQLLSRCYLRQRKRNTLGSPSSCPDVLPVLPIGQTRQKQTVLGTSEMACTVRPTDMQNSGGEGLTASSPSL